MVFRVIFVVAGLALLAAVVFLGSLTASDQSLVPWFGIASAVLAPSGFALIGSAFSSADKLAIRRLSKVPEIQELINKATTQEQKLKALQAEREDLLKVIEYEAQTQALEARRWTLQSDAARVLAELESTEVELGALNKAVSANQFSADVEKLRDRIRAQRRGDVVVRLFGADVVFPRAALTMLPFYQSFEVIGEGMAALAGALTRKRRP